ncbi:sodium/hydrogen exchanger 8 isoform X2 [Strongylocentrotus purpuratus]|uniref:Sodium/hydrogen exchanger n=1 Tax=Strongylocentrotus purpuratus TaxID=7668 RepID=A0A7M7REB0_STRPU|nr:sodium/hydrogen exchanger 8 isoform X2 [Strongylocentrotus purpuratus]
MNVRMTKNTEMKRFGVILFAVLFAGLLTVSYGEATGPGQETTGPVPETARVTPGEQQDASISSGYDGGGDDLRSNETTSTTHVPTTTKKITEPADEQLPEIGSAEEEHSSSLALFFILGIIGVCILLTHLVIKLKFHYLPESVAIVCLGVLVGLVILALKHTKLSNHDFTQDEILDPTTFFLVLLPPIIFESGYSLHKGNFFQNIGSILVFAIFGTIISTLIVGGGVYLLGQAKVAYELTLVESFAFGSLISAVDPVATIAIFSALDVHPLLNMLVFGESILNDAVSIVLSNTVIALDSPEMADVSALHALGYAVGSFCVMLFGSSLLGIALGLISALLLKHVDLRNTPSLEFGLMLIFAYLPYALAEGIKLSGIMAILFCGIVMSHYTHYNLSPVTQINMQHSFRTMAFLAETCVFMYLGLAIPSFNHRFEPALVLWSIVLILVGRAFNTFPLSFICNKFREHKITFKMQFVMWFSGLRGAIAYALSMHLEFGNDTRHVLVTTTLVIVLFTVIGFGGSTLPLLKCIGADNGKSKKEISLSKTEEMGSALDAEHLSELTEEEYEVNYIRPGLKGFLRWDTKYLTPFFTRRLTNKEITDGRFQMRQLTNRWYSEVRGPVSDTDDETELIGN